ncbi:MAG: Serine hydroxymethyltransferase [Micavibrio sp.]|nr:Serine hydroxymethyltransferase [Micavibrio sp.]
MNTAAKKMENDMGMDGFFTETLQQKDEAIYNAIRGELGRQQHSIELIASENIVSKAVLEAQGSVLTNKYAEGYPGKRYYGGCEHVDVVEQIAIDRACKLFGCTYANVQPNSGSQANQAVYFALLNPGDKVLGMRLDHGGHLTHGMKLNMSGKWFDFAHYGVSDKDQRIDFVEVRKLAAEHKPKMIVCGASAYSRAIDWAEFRKVADEIGAYLFVDMAHYAGLVAGGAYPSPIPHAHVTTTTTHKTLRGPRGGMILSNDEEIGKLMNKSVFPGLQGGPLMHVIAGKAVCFGEALEPEFKVYAQQVVANARVLADTLKSKGFDIVSGGTDSHVMLVDLRPKKLTGVVSEKALDRAGLTCNKNTIPYDPEKAMVTSGIRLGTPAGTTRGFGEAEFKQVGELISRVLDGLVAHGEEGNAEVEKAVKADVAALCARFPVYGGM